MIIRLMQHIYILVNLTSYLKVNCDVAWCGKRKKGAGGWVVLNFAGILVAVGVGGGGRGFSGS